MWVVGDEYMGGVYGWAKWGVRSTAQLIVV